MIVQIRDICSAVYSGGTPNRKHLEYYEGGDIPWLNTSEVVFNRIYKTEKHITQSGLKNSSAKWIPENSVIVAMYGATAGRTAIAKKPLTTNQACCNLIIDPEKADYRYVYYYLYSKYQHLLSMANGGAQQNLNAGQIKEYMINLPDLQTQKKIADILDLLDSKIELNNTINNNLQQQAAALFSSLYDRSNTEVKFTDLIQILGGGTPKTGENTYWNGNIAFFTPKDVGIPYTLITEKTISKEGLSHCNSRLYPVNTVFVTARGTVGKVGMSGVPMAMNQSCYALVGKETHQLLVYFYTLKAVDRLKHKASGAVFDAITTRDFESEQIMKLSDDDATAFLRVAEPMFQEVLNNNIENLRLSTLRDSLLPKLMSGEIDVSAVQL